MAYPTGSGSEILRRGIISPQSNSATAFRFDGTSPTVGTASYTVPALHIITMSVSYTHLTLPTNREV